MIKWEIHTKKDREATHLSWGTFPFSIFSDGSEIINHSVFEMKSFHVLAAAGLLFRLKTIVVVAVVFLYAFTTKTHRMVVDILSIQAKQRNKGQTDQKHNSFGKHCT